MPSSALRRALASAPPDFHIAIVGSGFGGLCAAIQLKRAGFSRFTILEKDPDVGGTWRDNAYPGAACDVQSHLYSFSFAPWPKWRRVFAEQEQILEYTRHLIERFELQPHLRLGAAVTSARFDDASGRWTLDLNEGQDTLVANAVISATGGLSQPRLAELPGVAEFGGVQFHTARWPQDVDLRGKRVAVIGTGASAIQIVPEIAGEVAHLDLYQRTPPWILPKPDREIGAGEQALYERMPALQWLQRQRIYWSLEPRVMAFAVSPQIMRAAQILARLHLRKAVSDPELRARVTPDYVIGCKRILMSNDYYDALQRPDVTLHDGGASGFSKDAVLDAQGQAHPADVVIHATGFHAAEAVIPYDIRGRASESLAERWTREGPSAFKGTTISGFPNLYVVVGPNTGLGHSSMIYMIESQVAYALDGLRTLLERRARWLDVRPDAQDEWNAQLQRRLARTVWASGCNAWYQTASGRNTTLWPGFTWDFRLRTRRFDVGSYELG